MLGSRKRAQKKERSATPAGSCFPPPPAAPPPRNSAPFKNKRRPLKPELPDYRSALTVKNQENPIGLCNVPDKLLSGHERYVTTGQPLSMEAEKCQNFCLKKVITRKEFLWKGCANISCIKNFFGTCLFLMQNVNKSCLNVKGKALQ